MIKNIAFLLLFFVSIAAAQQSATELKIIPSSNAATGTVPGTVKFQAKNGLHFTGLSGADTIPSNQIFRLPTHDIPGGGCINTDGVYNLSAGPCGGANSTSVSPTNPMLLYAHFRDDDSASLYWDYSRDYINFRPLRKGGWPSPTPIRDPSVYLDTATSTWWMIASPSTASCLVQVWSTTDLVNYSAITTINFAPLIAGCNGVFAPEWNLSAGPTGQLGIQLQVTNDDGVTQHPQFAAYNPAVSLTAYTATAYTISGTASTQTFDVFPLYDTPSTAYYLAYVDHQNDSTCPDNGGGVLFCQKIAYAKSTTLTGTYTQQTAANLHANSTDHFAFGNRSEAPSIMPLVDSLARYGVADCLRLYADTWTIHFPGVRQYTFKYVDTCPASVGTDPFANVMQAQGWGTPVEGVATAAINTAASFGAFTIVLKGLGSGTLRAGDVFTVGGHAYTIQANATVSGATATVSISPYLQGAILVNDVVTSIIATPVKISASEHGTIIAITDQATANIVYKAEDLYRAERRDEGRHVFGRTPESVGFTPFLITANSAYNTGYLAYDQPAEIGAGGPDPGDANGYSYASWSACGIDPGSCPVPNGGDGKWIHQYGGQPGASASGSDSQLLLSVATPETGESSISFGNGTYSFANPHPLTASTLAKQSQWSMGENNQNFGPMAASNVANNWFFVYNFGLGCVAQSTSCSPFGDPTFTNSGFESGLTGWFDVSGTASATSAIQARSGTFSLAQPTAGEETYRTITGLTTQTTYVVTAWVRTTGGTGNGFLKLDDGFAGNVQTGSAVNPGAQWYQVGHQFATGTGTSVRIILSRGFGTGTVYWDDIKVHEGRYPGGSFPFGISASTGEVRANYGYSLGGGDTTYQGSVDWIGMASPTPGQLNIGSGRMGDSDANLVFGTFNAGNAITPSFNDSFATARLEYFGGGAANSTGAGLIFAQQYDTTLPTTMRRVGGIFGYKQNATGSLGGGLAFYTQPLTGDMAEGARLDKDGIFRPLNGFGLGPLASAYANIYAPSAGNINLGNGSAASTLANLNFGSALLYNVNQAQPVSSIQSLLPSGNGALLAFNAQNVSGVYKALVTGNRAGYIQFDNSGMKMLVSSSTQVAGTALGGFTQPMAVDTLGGVSFGTLVSVQINNSAPAVSTGNKLEIIGVSGVDGGNAFGSATSTDGITTYWGSKTATEGFLGTYSNHPFALRQNNADVLTLPTAGGVAVLGNLNVGGSGIYQIGASNGVNTSITCTFSTITLVGGGTMSVCTGITTHAFSGGIKTN